MVAARIYQTADASQVKVGRGEPVERRLALRSCRVLAAVVVPALAAGTLAAEPGAAQAGVQVGANVLVSGDAAEMPHVEPHLAVDPGDPRHLLGAAMWVDLDGRLATAAYTSFDAGQSWRRREFPQCEFDPWVAFARDGTAYHSCVAHGDVGRVVVFRSDDGGLSWGGAAEVPRAERTAFDHSSIIVNGTEGPWTDNVYVVTMQARTTAEGALLSYPVVSSSSDRGLTFTSPVGLLVTNVWANTLSPVVLSDGVLGLAYMDYAVDNGAGGKAVSLPRAWWVSSADGGRTFSIPSLIAEVRGWTTLPLVAVDMSTGTYRDRLYLAVDAVRADGPGLLVFRSEDRGLTWSDAGSVPLDSAGRAANPVVAVNPAGVVGVAYYSRTGSPNCWSVRFSASLDGGASFGEGVPVSEETFCTRVPGNVVGRDSERPFDVTRRWPAGGDYFGLAAGSDGRFHVLWADSRTGVYQLWTAPVTVTGY